MRITIIAVGKIKEKYFMDAIDEYKKRLQKYCKINIIEVADEKTIENATDKENDRIKEKEAERILKNIPGDAYVITLEILGKMLDSIEFADAVEHWAVNGRSHLCFIIGGSVGLHKSVSVRADFKLSFSKMTFPHQLMRVVLLEQIYRAFRINSNAPYHK